MRHGRVKINQTWQIICSVPLAQWHHQLLWSTHHEGECFVLYIQWILFNWFIFWCQIWWVLSKTISFTWHGKLFKSTCSLAVVTGICPYIQQNARAAYIVVSLETETSPSAGSETHWPVCQDCSLNGCWWEYDEQNLSWVNTLGIIDSNQHDLPAGRYNINESFPLQIAISSLPNFSLTDLRQRPPT